MWFVVAIFTATITCLFTSAFFNAPWPLRDRLFTSAVAARAGTQGMAAVAAAARQLSEPALLKLVQLNDSRNMIGYFEPDSNRYVMSPIPAEVEELDTQGMIAWSEPKPQLQEFLSRFGLSLARRSSQPQAVVLANISAADKEHLRESSYRLNKNGLSLYRLLIETLVKQLHD